MTEQDLAAIIAGRDALKHRIDTAQYMQTNELTGLGCCLLGEEWRAQLKTLDKFIQAAQSGEGE